MKYQQLDESKPAQLARIDRAAKRLWFLNLTIDTQRKSAWWQLDRNPVEIEYRGNIVTIGTSARLTAAAANAVASSLTELCDRVIAGAPSSSCTVDSRSLYTADAHEAVLDMYMALGDPFGGAQSRPGESLSYQTVSSYLCDAASLRRAREMTTQQVLAEALQLGIVLDEAAVDRVLSGTYEVSIRLDPDCKGVWDDEGPLDVCAADNDAARSATLEMLKQIAMSVANPYDGWAAGDLIHADIRDPFDNPISTVSYCVRKEDLDD